MYSALGAAIALLVAEVFITLAVFVLLWRQKLNPFQPSSLREVAVPS
jgi:Na+-driven multidrug efflux pump